MGELSHNNYSTYPPIAQLFYSFSFSIAGSNLVLNTIIIRCLQILAEVGLVVFSLKILKKLNLPQKQILFFVMNPLVILESTFSLHFEVVMLLFLALSLFYAYAFKVYQSALGLALAGVSKLLPLMFIPLFFSYLNKKDKLFNRHQLLKFVGFCAGILLCMVLAYSYFWTPELLQNNSSTLSLYITSFEFNASLYYVLRWIGYQISGYNMISLIGKLLAVLTLGIIVFLSLKKKAINFKTLVNYMLLGSTAYYLLSTTVHPWYIMLPLFLSLFTTYRFMLVWSWLIFLSYSAYLIDTVEEKLWLVAIEYLVVIGMIVYELLGNKKTKISE
jgi:hypothetical protein